MLLRVYGLYDVLSAIHLQPFFARTDTDALRQMKSSLGDTSVQALPIYTNAKDFKLYFYGTFDDETGVIDISGGSKILCDLGQIKEMVALEIAERAAPVVPNVSDDTGGSVSKSWISRVMGR